MDTNRRSLMTAAMLVGVATGLMAEVDAAGAPAPKEGETTARKIRQVIAAREISNCLNRYTAMQSLGRVSDMEREFATSVPDVQVDVGFGWYYGADGIRRFCGVNGMLVGDVKHGTLINGATLLFGNTSEIIEVAQDLNTAKGLWLTWLAASSGDASSGYGPRTGFSRHALDFIQIDGEWKIWHYVAYGLTYAPPGHSWTDSDVVTTNQNTHYDWIPSALRPDGPSSYGTGTAGTWRPDRPMIQVRVPAPYRTFSETFSYARMG
jgi:hypothetical protein